MSTTARTRARVARRWGTFRAQCHLQHGRPSALTACQFDTDDPALFALHMREQHNTKPLRGAAETFRPWRAPRPTKEFTSPLGAWVTFEHKGRTRTGQVWALAPRRSVWVADGTSFYSVDQASIHPTPERQAA